MSERYGKLVRDKVPEIIEASGAEPVIRILDDGEFDERLQDKASEELGEFVASRSLEELADVQEVLDTIRDRMGYSETELKAEQQRKRDERGGFANRIFLEGVE